MKNFTKIHPNKNYSEVLSSATSKPAILQKKNPMRVIFRWLLKRFLRTVFCVRTLVKKEKERKFLPKYVLAKSRTENFHKIHPKETVLKSFHLSDSLQLYWKRTPSQLFPYVIEAIKICLKDILKTFKISIN